MRFMLIYPKWPKLERQTEFHLPPHGPVVFAATLPDEVEIKFVDEDLETIDFDDPVFCGLMAKRAQRAVRAVLRLVHMHCFFITVVGGLFFSAHLFHHLTHRAVVAIFGFIVVQPVLMERIFIGIIFLLLLIEAAELHKGFDIVLR